MAEGHVDFFEQSYGEVIIMSVFKCSNNFHKQKGLDSLFTLKSKLFSIPGCVKRMTVVQMTSPSGGRLA